MNLLSLMNYENPNLKLKEQISWLVANICAIYDENITKKIIEMNVVDIFWPYLKDKTSADLTERILLILGNLMYRNTLLKKQFIQKGFFIEILNIATNEFYNSQSNWPAINDTFLFFLRNFIDSDLEKIGLTFVDCLPL